MKQPINSETLAQSILEALEAELFNRILEADRGREQFLLLEGLDLWAILALPMLAPAPPAKTWFFETEAEARAKFGKLTGQDPDFDLLAGVIETWPRIRRRKRPRRRR